MFYQLKDKNILPLSSAKNSSMPFNCPRFEALHKRMH